MAFGFVSPPGCLLFRRYLISVLAPVRVYILLVLFISVFITLSLSVSWWPVVGWAEYVLGRVDVE